MKYATLYQANLAQAARDKLILARARVEEIQALLKDAGDDVSREIYIGDAYNIATDLILAIDGSKAILENDGDIYS